MASIYSSTKNGWKLRLDWSITGQSIANNTSTLSLDLWVYDGTGYSQNEYSNQAYYIIQGEKHWNPYNYSTSGWYKLGSKTVTVSHNADGTKSVALSAEWDCGFDSQYTPRHLSLSQTVTLTTIPRSSTATTSGSALGETLTITIKRASSSFTHKLYYTCGSVKDQLIADNVSTSYSWNAPPVSLAQQAPNAETVALTLTVKTYNGSTYVGAWSTQVKLSVPLSVVPSISVTIGDPTGVKNTYGGYVQLRSKVKVDITASGVQGSSIKSYSIKVGDFFSASASSGSTDLLPNAGALSVICAVTDSRGRTATKTQSITVLAYSKPAITAISAARCNSDSTANRAGSYGKVTFSGAITSLSSKNTAAYAVQYREVGAMDWTTAGRPAVGNYAPADISAVFAADKSKRYEVRVVATDAFESIGSTLRDLPAAYALYHLAKHLLSVGLGRLCDKANAIQVGLDAYFDGDVQIDGTLVVGGTTLLDIVWPVGSVYLSAAEISPQTLFGGTWEQIKGRFLLASDDGHPAGSTGGEETHALTKAEIPDHAHTLKYTGQSVTEGVNAIRLYQAASNQYNAYSGGQSSDCGGQAHNNMPPYLAVYVWKRTA